MLFNSRKKRRGRSSLVAVVVAGLVGSLGAAVSGGTASAEAAGPCPPGVSLPTLSPEYKASVKTALDSGPDVWGQQVLSSPEGPTYGNVKDFLKPLMYLKAPVAQGKITDSEVYYLPFGVPEGLSGRGSIALHVADGSQIITDRVSYRNLTVSVGDGTERYGSCLADLDGPGLYHGYLPGLEVGYTDAQGVRYHQESFATYLPGTEQVASYVRIDATGTNRGRHATIRLHDYCGDACQLSVDGNRLVKDGKTYLYFSPGATFDGTNLDYDLDLPDHRTRTVYLVRVNEAAPAPAVTADAAGHAAARARMASYWNGRLGQGATVDVPEPLVDDAMKNLLVQNLLSTWRYSLGNVYEAFYQPESSDTLEALGHLGFTDVYKSALTDLLPKSKGANRRNWEIGTKLYHAVDYYNLTGDPSLIEQNESAYVGYAEDLMAQNAADPNGLLERQQYSSDIKHDVYGLHQIGWAQRGIQDMAETWRALGRSDLADRYAPFAATLETNYQDAVRDSQVRMPDGSLFTAVDLLDGIQPWDPITATTLGGYYNLVAPHGFGTRAYPPGSQQAADTLSYLENHGSRLLGLLRARDSADDNVYEVEQEKFLADNATDEKNADQLVLSLYGKLANGMTRGTFVSGEAHNIGPILTKWPTCRGKAGCVPPSIDDGWTPDEYYRAMYLPPNSANNTSFLEALRQMLTHTVTDPLDNPTGLQLAYSTPRGWLAQGKSVRVANLPTEFGPLGYRIHSDIAHHRVTATVDVPSRDPIGTVSLRLRVPAGNQLAAVLVDGRIWPKFDAGGETVDLSGLTGRVQVTALYRTVR